MMTSREFRQQTRPREIMSVRPTGREATEDHLAMEEPMEIRISTSAARPETGRSVAITMRTPGHDFELAAGFLRSEGFLTSRDEIVDISYCVDPSTRQEQNVVTVTLAGGVDFDTSRLERNFVANSSCGVCGKATLDSLELSGHTALQDDLTLTAEVITSLSDTMRMQQRGFALSGGLHAAALFSREGTLVAVREDVGRHNTVDKLVGARMLEGDQSLSNYALLVSGRAGFEILQKALVSRVPIVAAVGAPSTLAADLATDFGITLVGFLAEDSFNIYSHPERIES